jgi:hypothetical protein
MLPYSHQAIRKLASMCRKTDYLKLAEAKGAQEEVI